jgi:hypothetical protein
VSTTTYVCSKCKYKKVDEYTWTHKESEYDENFANDRDRFCLSNEEGEEYRQGKWSLEGLSKLMEDFKKEEARREEKLKENPKGFHLDGHGYTCAICHGSTHEGDNWFDKWGIKCLICQKAIDDKEIPGSLAKDRESWYSKYDLESCFNLKSATVRSWVKKGILKSRTISYYGKGIHYELFLIKENKDFLPPKKMVKSRLVSEVKDGKTWSHSEPWYKFVDPHKHLNGYKIMDYLKVVTKEESESEKDPDPLS